MGFLRLSLERLNLVTKTIIILKDSNAHVMKQLKSTLSIRGGTVEIRVVFIILSLKVATTHLKRTCEEIVCSYRTLMVAMHIKTFKIKLNSVQNSNAMLFIV